MRSFFVSVGEPSGDLLGAELVSALKNHMPDFGGFGIAGPRLRSENYHEIAGIEELSVMGFVEVIKHITYLKKLEDRLILEIDRRKPEFAILVDYPGFNMRLAEFLKVRDIPVIQYVAPQLWAWGEGRTSKLKAVTDLVLGIMPFEKDFFIDRGVTYQYVGTPQVDRASGAIKDHQAFKLDPQTPSVGFFPGSRNGEVSKMVPMAREIRECIRNSKKEIQFAVSIAPSVSYDAFLQLVSESQKDRLIGLKEGESVRIEDTTYVKGRSLDLMASVSSALVTSGTATLECALVKTPLSVTYRMNKLSFALAKRLVKLDHVSLVNLVAGKAAIKEFIQEFTFEEVGEHLISLASAGETRNQAVAELNSLDRLVVGDLANGAARAIKKFLGEWDNSSP